MCAYAQSPAVETPAADRVVISVGEEKITAAEFETFVDGLPDQYRNIARGPAKRQIAEQLVSMKTLAQEGRKRKLDQTPQFKRQLAIQTENTLAGVLYQDLSSNLKIDDAAAREYYEKHKGEYEQARARHILVRAKNSQMPLKEGAKELTDEEALAKATDLRKRLLAGEDFAALAKAESDDSGSGANGGDLGLFKRGAMVPAFEQTAFSIPVKQVSEPVKTQFGYHLILVEQREAKTFDEIRPELEKKMRPELAKQALENLKKTTPVTLDESYFGPAR